MGDVSVVIDLYREHGAFIHTISQELAGAAADRLTQQVFTEAWQNRLDFNPSLGTVRNWLIRRARTRAGDVSAEVDAAVDGLVVADSLNRMDELRRQVVLAGIDVEDAESLARHVDQPVATIRSNLRRGSDQLKADLADSRPDADNGGLAGIMLAGPPALEMVRPPEVVWQAIAAELQLDTGAVTSDDFDMGDSLPSEQAVDLDGEVDEAVPDGDASEPDESSDANESPDADESSDPAEPSDADAPPDEGPSPDGDDAGDPESGVDTDEPPVADEVSDTDEISDTDDLDESEAGSDEGEDGEGEPQSLEELRRLAEMTDLDQRSWFGPIAIAVGLLVLLVILLVLAL